MKQPQTSQASTGHGRLKALCKFMVITRLGVLALPALTRMGFTAWQHLHGFTSTDATPLSALVSTDNPATAVETDS